MKVFSNISSYCVFENPEHLRIASIYYYTSDKPTFIKGLIENHSFILFEIKGL